MMESTLRGYSKEEIEEIRQAVTKRSETDSSIDVEGQIAFMVNHFEQNMDVDWGDTPTLSSFAMAIYDEKSIEIEEL